MIELNVKLNLEIEAGHWYIDKANECQWTIAELIENVLENYYYDKMLEEID